MWAERTLERTILYVMLEDADCQDDTGRVRLGIQEAKPVELHILCHWRVQYFDLMCVRILHTLFMFSNFFAHKYPTLKVINYVPHTHFKSTLQILAISLNDSKRQSLTL